MKSKRLRMLHANFIQKIPLLFKNYIKTATYYMGNHSKIILLKRKKGFYIMKKEEKLFRMSICSAALNLSMILSIIIALVVSVLISYSSKQEKEKVADEYKAEGYIICKANDLKQYAISKDELEKYKNKAETVTLYTLPDKEEIVKNTNTTDFKLLKINDIQSLYRKEDSYACELTTPLEYWGAISKTEYERYKNGDSFYMTVFYENKNRAELIDTSTINSIQKD